MYPYDEMPDLSNINVSHDTIDQVPHDLLGSSRLVGVDSQAVAHWLFGFSHIERVIETLAGELHHLVSQQSSTVGGLQSDVGGETFGVG
jgi:hypothetical protein